MRKHLDLFIFVLFMLLTGGCSSGEKIAPPLNLPTTQLQETAVQTPTETNTVVEIPDNNLTATPITEDTIVYAINLVMGTEEQDSVYPSYHLDVNLSNPVLSEDEITVVTHKLQISADVEGKNVHLLYTPDGEPTREGYLIGDKEYQIVDGKPQEMLGQIALSWVSWPLQAWGYNAAVQFAGQTGSEVVEGRQATVYTVDTTQYNVDELKTLTEMGLYPITDANGQVWIDQQTKGLLKASIAYKTDVRNMDTDTVVGSGDGTVEIVLSKIGEVHVIQP